MEKLDEIYRCCSGFYQRTVLTFTIHFFFFFFFLCVCARVPAYTTISKKKIYMYSTSFSILSKVNLVTGTQDSSTYEYNEIMFLREITHTVNAFNDMADIVRLYSKKPEMAEQRLENLLSEVLYEDSDSV